MSEGGPIFDFCEGTGTALKEFPFYNTNKRGSNAKIFEASIEPLHRLAYGRAGQAGTRRHALEDFKGFPVSMREGIHAKLTKLTKDKLRALIKALEMPVKVSQPHASVVAGVENFLMHPVPTGKSMAGVRPTKASAQGSTRRAPKEAVSKPVAKEEEGVSTERETHSDPPAKRARTEISEGQIPNRQKSPSRSSPSTLPSEDAVRVQVFRRVLAMSPAQRSNLGVKALRTELEAFFKMPAGELKRFKDAIAQTASDCVKALMEAEGRTVEKAATAGDFPHPNSHGQGGVTHASPAAGAPPEKVHPPAL
ncbi:unnamed protein product [Phytomonas sp. EM1]|nr:unnamed protein product [Phytomonas sp. EM1]|eukprot:CCW64276.1 unnamed protein product [Phytomonas sp. isolate EM1]